MEEKGADIALPTLPTADMKQEPWLDFSSGYVQRAVALLPKQGAEAPWKQNQDYFKDIKEMRKAPIEDTALVFSTARAAEVKASMARAAE